MIISVSRRTDIPAWYSDWFFARLRAGFADVRNPYRPRQISRIVLTPDLLDGMVFWSKNPLPMMERLHELQDMAYYFQFTLTPYGRDIEPFLPSKREVLLPAFQRLSSLAGKGRVVWRYDPILLTERYTPDYHRHAFRAMAEGLEGHTDECIVSLVDDYACIRRRMQQLGAVSPTGAQADDLLKYFAETARQHGMKLSACCEAARPPGVSQARCIDPDRLSIIAGVRLPVPPDKNQREGCGCAQSVDIGSYDTCRSGCAYCYANHGHKRLEELCAQYDPGSSMLCGCLSESDVITLRPGKRYADALVSLP